MRTRCYVIDDESTVAMVACGPVSYTHLINQRFSACLLASLAGFEPTAFRLGGERSILLSYRDIYSIKIGNDHFSS